MVKIFSLLFAVLQISTVYSQTSISLDFDLRSYKEQALTVDGRTFEVRAFENIVYVKNPVDTTYQILNIYIPEEYFQGKSINGYTAESAPVFFPNQIGGYMPAKPATLFGGGFGPPDSSKPSTVAIALSKGYVVASAGARGRTTADKNGKYTGKAPAAIVDLKAAVRYLKYNDKRMPGNAAKIISNGTSAGGALSVLLGATGNNKDYEPYLKALGAANTTDDIFAVSGYAAITNLDHADKAYEWQFNGVSDYKRINISMLDYKVQRKELAGTLTQNETSVSNELKAQFPAYINSLALKDEAGKRLSLDANGNGSFKELVKSYVIASAQKVINNGKDLSSLKWLTVKNGKVTALDFDVYVRYTERQKSPPAFDALNLSSGENQEFGASSINKQHFTKFSSDHSTVKATRAEEKIVKMMNPMYYIGAHNTNTAKYWRLRQGTKDKDTGLAIPIVLATYLQNKGYSVNLELPWDRPHSGDYDLEELFQWIAEVCK